ncbi:MAG: ABC transporter ATP-binding protein, partial [Actinomycetota bacterium]
MLRIEGLNKRFPHVWANRDVSLDVHRAEIHCLLGENGAGKTTLAECLYGTYRPDSGQVTFMGEPLVLSSPRDAIRAGIGMVHQHFVLAPALSVVENVIAGTPTRFIVDKRQEEKRLAKLCKDYGLDLDLRAAISHLSVGEQQWVEILKALYLGVDLLILDEPTAVLTPMETDRLFAIVERMKADGLSVIFITHRLDEVMQLSDRVTVLRRGQVMDTVETSQVDKAELARMMVGRDVVFLVEKEPLESGSPLLEVRDLRVRGDRGQEALRGISFSVREREILGVAGVSGNGQRELFEVLVGVRMPSEGRVLLNGADITY